MTLLYGCNAANCWPMLLSYVFSAHFIAAAVTFKTKDRMLRLSVLLLLLLLLQFLLVLVLLLLLWLLLLLLRLSPSQPLPTIPITCASASC